jgi:hypothetical protein
MEKVISLYLNKDRTYFTKIASKGGELELEHIGSTESPFLFDEFGKLKIDSLFELNNLLDSLSGDFDRIHLIYPAIYSLISLIPYSEEITPENLAAMLEIETKRTFAGSNPEDFNYDFYMIANKKIMTVVSPLIISEQMNHNLGKYGAQIYHYHDDDLSALNSFCNNYPDLQTQNSAVISLQNNFMTIYVVTKNHIIYTKSIHYSSSYGIPPVFEREINDLLAESITDLKGGIYFWGADLTKELLSELQQLFSAKNLQCQRLNPFRKLISGLNEREQEYASRAMQYFSPCIGASFPNLLSH